MTIVICGLPEWRTNDVEGEVIESIKRSSGLWSRCTFYNTGNWQCDQYDTFFLGLPTPLQMARAATCIALAFQGLGTLAAFVGMDCTSLIPSNTMDNEPNPIKKKIMMVVGGFNIFAGVILCIGVSYYASHVLDEYNGMSGLAQMGGRGLAPQRSSTGERYVYGQCLFIGWAAMLLDLAAGAIMICGSCGSATVGTESMYGTGRLMSNQFQPSLENIVQSGLPHKGYAAKDQQYI